MPIIFVNGALVHFAHVPRCGGSAIENYLKGRFGPMALLDRQHYAVPPGRRWSRSSPQHMDAETLERLVPRAMVRASFAVVRHPQDRILSVFRYQRDVDRKIPRETGFEDWLAALPETLERDPHHLDNHPRPMVEMVPEGAVVFRFEDGLDRVVDWLDELEGTARGARRIQPSNGYEERVDPAWRAAMPELVVTPRAAELIAAIYEADFDRFGYAPSTVPAGAEPIGEDGA